MVIAGVDLAENLGFISEAKQLQNCRSRHWAGTTVAANWRVEVPACLSANDYQAVETVNDSFRESVALRDDGLRLLDGFVGAFVEYRRHVERFSGIAECDLRHYFTLSSRYTYLDLYIIA